MIHELYILYISEQITLLSQNLWNNWLINFKVTIWMIHSQIGLIQISNLTRSQGLAINLKTWEDLEYTFMTLYRVASYTPRTQMFLFVSTQPFEQSLTAWTFAQPLMGLFKHTGSKFYSIICGERGSTSSHLFSVAVWLIKHE